MEYEKKLFNDRLSAAFLESYKGFKIMGLIIFRIVKNRRLNKTFRVILQGCLFVFSIAVLYIGTIAAMQFFHVLGSEGTMMIMLLPFLITPVLFISGLKALKTILAEYGLSYLFLWIVFFALIIPLCLIYLLRIDSALAATTGILIALSRVVYAKAHN